MLRPRRDPALLTLPPWRPRASLAFLVGLFLFSPVWNGCRGAGSRVHIEAAAATTVAVVPADAGGLSPVPDTAPVPASEHTTVPLALVLSFTFPVDEVSEAQAEQILSGRVSRWSQVGGPDQPLRLLGWERDRVVAVDSADPLPAGRGAPAAALLTAVSQQPGAVALLAWGGSRLRAKALSVEGRRPDDPNYPFRMEITPDPAGGTATGDRASAGRFTLTAVGDLMLGRRVAQRANSESPDYPLALARPVLQRGDLGVGNLEVALTDRGEPQRKDYVFRAAPSLATGLRAAGIGLVSLANNHLGDYGVTGITDTLGALDGAGLAHAGAGTDATAAAAPALFEGRGVRVAFLSFVNVPADVGTGFSTAREVATSSSSGINWGTPESVKQAVTDARTRSDVVVVSLHAGIEYAAQPDQVQRSLAHAAVDAGAALVLGSHPHVLQGIEYYGDGVILYSLGNFVFDIDREDVRNLGLPAAQTVVATLSFEEGRVSGLELSPMVIDASEFRPVPAAGAAARSVLDRVYRLTDALNSH